MRVKGVAQTVATMVCATSLATGLSGAEALAAPAAGAFEPTLSYYTCPPKSLPAGVQCARLTVPLDWQTPNDGRTTSIDVRVMRSKEGKGGLTFNPGGPGSSGVEAFPAIYSLLPDDVASTFDFVGWDPRGVGGSGPKITGPARPFLGLNLKSGEPGGAEIAGTKPGSPAAKAGLGKGDIIIKISDRAIGNVDDVLAEVRASVPGESLVVEVRRGGAVREVTITVGSEESGCQYPNTYPASTGPVDWREFWQTFADEFGAANAACLAANPDSAPYVGTWQVIRDLDALREALGYSAWNYWGMSYGTRIGGAYARTFPTKLRALIMDGSMPADETIYGLGTTFPANLWISSQLFPTLAGPETARKVTVIEDYLNNAVVALPDGTEFTRWNWAEQFGMLLTAQSQYPTARALVNNLYGGITAKTQAARDKQLAVVAAIAGTVRSVIEEGMKGVPVQVLVNCSDQHDRPTVAELAAASEPVARNFGMTSVSFMGNSAACFELPPEDLSPAVSRGSGMVNLKTPPVFVLSSGDAATPWVWGRSLANTFVGSRTITYDSTQHVSYLMTPSDCVNATVTEYLLTLKLGPRNLGCAYAPDTPAPQR